MTKRTLLLPCVGKSSRFPGVRPKWMLTMPDGQLAIQHAAESVATDCVGRTVIAIRADHEASYGASRAIRRAFGPKIEVLIIDRDTNGPAETIAMMIEDAGVNGPFLVKDCDSFFERSAIPSGSFIAICDLRQNLALSRVGAKSFVSFDGRGLVGSISEKDVTSNFISVGLYGFSDAAIFLKSYEAITSSPSEGEVFVSRVIAEALARGEEFNPLFVSGLIDIGTLADWRSYSAKRQLLIVAVDGVLFDNQSEFFPPYWGEPMVPIQANVDHLLDLQRQGAQLLFVTSRSEKYRQATLNALGAAGLAVHELVMGCLHSTRVLINDYADSNPYPSAVAINVPQNMPSLPSLLR